METRKLIKFGNSSYVISLPGKWIKSNNLNKGDLIYCKENGQKELLLSSEIKKEVYEEKEIVVRIDGKTERDLAREIVSAYINNFKTVRMIGKEIEGKATKIIGIIHNLIALEIVDQTSESIVAKDFLNMKQISIIQLIRRMDVLTRNMIADSKNCTKTLAYDSLIRRDKDVNRLAVLALRTINFLLVNPHDDFDSISLFHFYIVYDNLERIADDTKRVARYLIKADASKSEMERIKDIYDAIDKAFQDTMRAYYLKDAQLAKKTSKYIRESIMKKCYEMETKTKNKNCAILAEKFKTMAKHVKTIDRINY